MLPPVAAAVDAAWRLNPLIELHWRDWGDDSVVLEARSGQLFQFDPLRAAMMACFEEGPRLVAEVADALAADLGSTADDEFRETVANAVQEFHRLGWLEPIIAG
jgi:PqqD family protein of HPr-rel-A system